MLKKYDRWQKAAVWEALATRRVVVIAGARQSGKTTLAKQIAGQGDIFRRLTTPPC